MCFNIKFKLRPNQFNWRSEIEISSIFFTTSVALIYVMVMNIETAYRGSFFMDFKIISTIFILRNLVWK